MGVPVGALLMACALGAVGDRIWEDRTLPVADRVAALIPQLSVEELAAQLRAPTTLSADMLIAAYNRTSVGLSWVLSAEDMARVNRAVLNNSRWKIPVAFYHESLHGGCFQGTIFPMPMLLGATFNPDLVREVYTAIGHETYACGVSVGFTPVINLFTDPRFGRFHEGFSPDPMMTAIYAKASVVGFQGDPSERRDGYLPHGKVATLAKHYVGYGGAAGGLNCGPLHASEREVRDYFLLPWRYYARYGGMGAMPSHQTVLEIPMHANKYMLNHVLRGELGFGSGLTVSDCNDIYALQGYRTATSLADAAAKALNAGVDQDLQCGTETYTYDTIREALVKNLTTLATVRAAAARVLTMKFATGVYDNPYPDPAVRRDIDPPALRALAKRAADEGIVLLKNGPRGGSLRTGDAGARTDAVPRVDVDDAADAPARDVLPLDRAALPAIRIVGWMASAAANQSQTGPYSSFGAPITTIQQALANAGATPPYAVGATPDDPADQALIDQAVDLAWADETAPAVVAVLGDSMNSCGEWLDRSSLDLPGGQSDLLDALIARRPAVSPPLVLVLMTARPTTFGPLNQQLAAVDAVVWAGRSGEEGGTSIVDVLTGAVNPSGKLQSNWLKSVQHVGSGASLLQHPVVGKWVFYQGNAQPSVTAPGPDGRVYANYWHDPLGDAAPLFPFGYGLSYTTFAYSALATSYDPANTVLTVTYSVTNTGGVAGAEASQVYVVDPAGSVVVRPWKRLVAFTKTPLAPGETKVVTLTVGYDELALSASDDVRQRAVPKGEWQVRVGGSSVTDDLVNIITIG